MLGMLVAYDGEGNVVATLSHLVARDDEGNAVGLVDFEEWEKAGKKFRNVPGRPGIWDVPGAVGSGAWPEHLEAHLFRVKVEGGRIEEMIHPDSGHRRIRSKIEVEIEKRRKATPEGEPLDLRDLVGGPGKSLRLDGEGKTAAKEKPVGLATVE